MFKIMYCVRKKTTKSKSCDCYEINNNCKKHASLADSYFS